MRNHCLFALTSALWMLQACTSTPVISTDTGTEESGAPIGVARISHERGVAKIPESVEHVLFPNNTTVPTAVRTIVPSQTVRPQPVTSSRKVEPITVSPVATLTAEKRATTMLVQEPVRVRTQEGGNQVNESWRRYCDKENAMRSMTKGDWEIVRSGSVPKDVLKDFPDCDKEK
jgi:hypothetical protein